MTADARAWLVGGGIAIVAAIGVGRLEGGLSAKAHAAKEQTDVSALPPPAMMRFASLGYEAAVADALWAKILVDYGTHWHDHRAFPSLESDIDAILALEPDFPALFKFVDTLLVYRPPRGTEIDARRARVYLERGLEARPNDHDLWLRYGQFLAYIAPSFLASDADKEAWRADGAHAMVRAVELGADTDRMLSSAHLLSRAGDREAEIQSLRRALALTEDEGERETLLAQLGALEDNPDRESAAIAGKLIDARERALFPFLSRTQFLLIGPAPDPLACAGATETDDCARSWDTWLAGNGLDPNRVDAPRVNDASSSSPPKR
jgi:hypothetical protein